ncbi:hypothetical protein B0J11DRAFT_586114 [Dendryphion nanum]|uniref:C2H2-type domain-containing protein n=1 Tax=Dendryphion nanum TaxID=256645 RepID=A0A9P9D0T3_9PLEO|nr:hypothetical protein B0J11DRAFT_586114 [Dendryphion nanum]
MQRNHRRKFVYSRHDFATVSNNRKAYNWDNTTGVSLNIDSNMTEVQRAVTKDDQYPWHDRHAKDTASWATDGYNVDPSTFDPLEWSYNVQDISDPSYMFHWREQAFDKSSLTLLASGLSRDGPTIVKDPHLDLNTGHPTLWLFEPRVPGDTTETERETSGSVSRQIASMNSGDNGVARIGSVLDNGQFVCDDEVCAGRTFARQADLRRHHTTLHATDKPNFWCHVSLCRRSMGGGGEAFHRKDKLMAHVRSMHPDM